MIAIVHRKLLARVFTRESRTRLLTLLMSACNLRPNSDLVSPTESSISLQLRQREKALV